jgi:Arc/MetJ-type ribon-helix-helix transcriptional regulator
MMSVSTQIAVRLPDALVAWIDEQVAAGGGSRAAVTTKALRRYQRQLAAEQDARIYRETGGYPDLEGMHEGRTFPEPS